MKNIIFIIMTFALLLLHGCNSKNEPENKANKVVCVLFDLSETTNTPEIRKNYLEKFKLILNFMSSGDAIEAALITEKSLSELDLSINYEFPIIKPFTDTDVAERIAKMQTDSIIAFKKDSVLAVADSILFKPKRKILYTEIMGSLQIAERVFKSFKQPRKILVIFSDMIEDSRKYNFEKENLTKKRINKINKTEKEKNQIPNLKDVKVYVIGASHPNSDRYNMIRDFWFEYLKACGANIETQNYGAALINFNE